MSSSRCAAVGREFAVPTNCGSGSFVGRDGYGTPLHPPPEASAYSPADPPPRVSLAALPPRASKLAVTDAAPEGRERRQSRGRARSGVPMSIPTQMSLVGFVASEPDLHFTTPARSTSASASASSSGARRSTAASPSSTRPSTTWSPSRAPPVRLYARFRKGDSFVASGYVHEYEVEVQSTTRFRRRWTHNSRMLPSVIGSPGGCLGFIRTSVSRSRKAIKKLRERTTQRPRWLAAAA